MPDEMKEYLAIYTTEYDDCYVLETIAAEDLRILRSEMDGQPERVMEAAFNYDVKDENAGEEAISDVYEYRTYYNRAKLHSTNDYTTPEEQYSRKAVA